MSGLVERLREHATIFGDHERIMQHWYCWRKMIAAGHKGSLPRDAFESLIDGVGDSTREAADEITRLTARVAELEGALRPFAEIETSEGMPDGFLRTPDGHAVVFNGFGKNLTIAVTVGDVRCAKAALEPKP